MLILDYSAFLSFSCLDSFFSRWIYFFPLPLWQTGRHAFVWGNGLLNSFSFSRLVSSIPWAISFPSTSPWLNDGNKRIFLIGSTIPRRINVSNCCPIWERQPHEQEVLVANAIRQDNLIKCSRRRLDQDFYSRLHAFIMMWKGKFARSSGEMPQGKWEGDDTDSGEERERACVRARV